MRSPFFFVRSLLGRPRSTPSRRGAAPTLLALIAAACPTLAGSSAAGQNDGRVKPPARPVPVVVVLRRAGLRVYEQVAEEFRGGVRAAVRVLGVPTKRESRARLRLWLRESKPDLVFTIGQSAYDMAKDLDVGGEILHALVFHRQNPKHHAIKTSVPPQAALSAFRAARPHAKRIAVLFGSATAADYQAAVDAASQLSLELVPLRAKSPAHALSLLRRLPRKVSGLWLLPDLKVLTPQVFQYAIGIQLRRRLPLMGATRNHVTRGALFALDYDPTAIGQRASKLAARLLRDSKRRRRRRWRYRRRRRRKGDRNTVTLGSTKPRLTVSKATAVRIGVSLGALRVLATEVLQ